jgi:hypothetical protein
VTLAGRNKLDDATPLGGQGQVARRQALSPYCANQQPFFVGQQDNSSRDMVRSYAVRLASPCEGSLAQNKPCRFRKFICLIGGLSHRKFNHKNW